MAGVNVHIAAWEVDGLAQYGVVLAPATIPGQAAHRLPLLLYLHGAAFGVPPRALPWLARMARNGYCIVGPALRGEALFATYQKLPATLSRQCGGTIENLDGEVDDALAAVSGMQKLDFVQPGSFAIIGHSFGAGVGLLVAARSADAACVISYDAWLTNPFRYYWDRMRRGANNWLSWEEFCSQPVTEHLPELMKRSVTHHAERIACPLLLFIGGAYEGSVFHLSHADFIANLKKHGKSYDYDVVPDGDHNFVLDYDSTPARYAYRKHLDFLRRHLPPAPFQP
jgi:dipeptidyl aminopeptidase/acylaminoacyl peptidase